MTESPLLCGTLHTARGLSYRTLSKFIGIESLYSIPQLRTLVLSALTDLVVKKKKDNFH